MKQEDAVARILDEQVVGYKMLLELLQRERLCLIDLDGGAVEALYKEKDVLILRLRLLEEERIRLMKDLGKGDLTLQKLGEMTGNNAFLDVRSKLRSLVQAIEELNNFNRLLIERSLSYFRNNAGFFSTFGFHEGMPRKGMLVSRET
ncbi:MAG: flagellar export chaperone FlgN [Nitrospirae bacterium]|nr:flagellar export chaperone FlgN [Nitrospirota bacterium]